MWLYLENESLIIVETITFALIFFGFQLTMALKVKHIALKLIPVYIFALFSVFLLVMPFVITNDMSGNWALILVTIFNLCELAFIALFIGFSWIAYAIISSIKNKKEIKR